MAKKLIVNRDWKDITSKEEKAEYAEQWFPHCAMKYSKQITEASDNTGVVRLLDEFESVISERCEGSTIFTEEITTDALFNAKGNVAVLNFGDYVLPGGQFLQGGRAQEESLCGASFLYNVLIDVYDYYNVNQKRKNKGYYDNSYILSPGIRFFDKANKLTKDVTVITGAMPHLTRWNKYDKSPEEYYKIIYYRVKGALELAAASGVDTFIVGAWGCGVFHNEPSIVAKAFNDLWVNEGYNKKIPILYFAIPDEEKLNVFQNAFEK